MGCEVILDIVNYETVLKTVPADQPELLRTNENKKRGNKTKKRFFLAVSWFLKKQAALTEVPTARGGDPEDPKHPDPNKKWEGLELDDPSAADKAPERVRFLAVAGLLLAESQTDALVGKSSAMLDEASGDIVDKNTGLFVAAPFKAAMTRALAELNSYQDHFEKVYAQLKARSVTADPAVSKFRARQLAEITRRLVAEGVKPSDSQFGVRFDRALSQSLSGGDDGPQSSIDIDLPDLEAGTEADIIGDNVLALSAIYFAAMLEELKFFAVMDKVVEQFMTGALPIKRSVAGDPLYRYHRDAQNRINEFERRGLYARSFGVAQGSVDEPTPNREFNDLWIRFLSAVSLYGREKAARQSIAVSVSQEQVFKSARDLAVNLSLHGFGLAHFAAVELQTLIKGVKDALSSSDVVSAYGVRDVWQLVERVSNMYLGGSVNGVRQRTMAQSGAAIIKWLANTAPTLIGPVGRVTVDDGLISHVERWLAVTGTPDQAVEKYSDPVALQSQRTIPDFALPSGAAADALRDVLSRANLPTPQN